MKLLVTTSLVLGLAAGSARADSRTSPYAAVALEETYDSNVFNARGQDVVTRVTPRLGILHQTLRLDLAADYRMALHAYAGGTAEGSINHRASLGARWQGSERLELHAGGVLLVGDDPVLLDRPGVIVPQGGFTDLALDAGGSWRSSRRGTLSADYTLRLSRFDLAGAPDPLAYDGDEHRLDVGYAYRLTRRLTGRLIGRGQLFDSYGATVSLGEAAGGGAGLEYRLTRLWRARAEGGPIWTPEGVGWFGAADLYRTGQRWRVGARFAHDLYGGTSAIEAVWSESLLLDAGVRLGKTMSLRARGGVYRGGPAPDDAVNVAGLQGRMSFAWQLFRAAELEVYAEHRAQDGRGGTAFGDVNRTVAGVRLTAVAGLDLTSLGETR
jgi:hypothetical protein